MGHVSIFERFYFDEHGEAVKWERSYDGKEWRTVDYPGDEMPFVLLRPIPLPAFIETEQWVTPQEFKLLTESLLQTAAPEPPPHR
jgi:hypothetical protein